MNRWNFKSYHLLTVLLLVCLAVLACEQNSRPIQPIAERKDSIVQSEAKAVEQQASYESDSVTPYTCAARSLKAMEQGNLQALIPYIHPVKGLAISHVDEYIVGHERPFSITEIQLALKRKTLYTVYSGYEQELRRKTTLADLLRYYSSSASLEGNSKNVRFFSTSKDIRRNHTGNGTYTLNPPLLQGQITISYHFSDSTNEMNWEELVLRTENYKGKDYLVEGLRAYWTP